jgi:glucose-1-phosphate thymidylyltransferase
MKKGIILAGGSGSRLFPLTVAVNKHLLNVYDKPMIYYPLGTLINLGIRNIRIVINERDFKSFSDLLGDGSKFGIKISFSFQKKPNGISAALETSKGFLNKNENFTLILGDNIFYGAEISKKYLEKNKYFPKNNENKVYTFCYNVNDPEKYGIAVIKNKKLKTIIEKPKKINSNLAVTGLYFMNSKVFDEIKNLKKSSRGEYEITDLLKIYISKNKCKFYRFKRGFTWIDAGSTDDLFSASEFVKNIEKRQGLKIYSLEELALNNKLISRAKYMKQIKKMKNNSLYFNYLKGLL